MGYDRKTVLEQAQEYVERALTLTNAAQNAALRAKARAGTSTSDALYFDIAAAVRDGAEAREALHEVRRLVAILLLAEGEDVEIPSVAGTDEPDWDAMYDRHHEEGHDPDRNPWTARDCAVCRGILNDMSAGLKGKVFP